MSVSEYLDKFTQMSRYARGEVEVDKDKQEHFLDGLNDRLQYLLMSHTFPNFQHMVNKALVVENKLR